MNEIALTFDDVLIEPQFNDIDSRQFVDISMTTDKLSLQLPIMSANMESITGNQMATYMHSKGGIGVLHRFNTIDDNVKEFSLSPKQTFVSIGCGKAELERAEALRDAGADYFNIDVAHAHASYVGQQLIALRGIVGDRCIMAGNVCTYEGAKYLQNNGADLVKAGIGGSGVCTTRIVTGHGMPQLTAVMECSRIDVPVVSDGGHRHVGDIVKALAFGAKFVMLGGMLAGTRPTPGDVMCSAQSFNNVKAEPKDVEVFGKTITVISCGLKFGHKCNLVKTYRGMASREVNEEYFGGLTEWKTAEGVSVEVPYREDEDEIMASIVGGIRSGLTYSGSHDIMELQQKKKYRIITSAGMAESQPHKRA